MIPILFNKDEKTFTSLGLGQMDATIVEVERERNGNYTLYAEVPFNSPQAKHLTKEMLIKADAGARTKWQTFKINRTIKDTNADVIKVYADHISMDTINDALKPKVVIRQQTAEGALRQWANNLVSGKAYDVQSDITHVGSTEWTIDEVENARQALGGVSGSILDVWGGEYEFDNNRIILHKEMGRTAPTVLEYGRNIVSLEYEELIDGVYTSIYPYATYTPKSEDNKQLPDIMVTLDELIVDSEYAGNYETRRIQIVDFSGEFDSNAENPEIPTQAKLRTLAKAYVKNNGYGIPKISQEIDFVDLSKTLDYQDIQVMEEIELNDRVPVYYPNIDAESNDVKVTTTNWDVLNNRYSKITLSTIGAMNSNSITSKLNTAIKDLKAEQKKINNTVPYLINAQGNRVWHMTPDENMEHKLGDTWFKKNGKYTIIYNWNGSMWEEVLNDETFITEIEAEVAKAQEEAEQAIQAAKDADTKANDALVKAGANANLLNTHQDTLNTIKNTTIPNINKSLSDAIGDAQSALSSASSAMDEAKKADGKIADYVTKNGLVSGTTVDSKIDTATGAISRKITTVEGKIPTEIGGRNYFQLTDFDTLDEPTTYGQNLISTSTKVKSIMFNSNNKYYEPGKYTLSFEMKVEEGYTESLASVRLSRMDSASAKFTSMMFLGRGELTDKWKKITYTFSIEEPNRFRLQIYNHAFGTKYNSEVYTRHFKLEKGNIATDWTLAPEDNYTQEEFKIFESTYNEDVKGITSSLSALENNKLDGSTYTTFYKNEYEKTAQGLKDSYEKIGKVVDENGNTTDSFAKAVYDQNATRQTLSFNEVTKDLVTTTTYTSGIKGVKDSITSVRGDLDSLSGGGRNYAVDTSNAMKYYLQIQTYSGNLGQGNKLTTKTKYTLSELGAKVGDWYTASIYIGQSGGFGSSVIVFNQNVNSIRARGNKAGHGYSSVTFQVLEGDTEFNFYLGNESGYGVDYKIEAKEFQIEKGKIRTAWKPALAEQMGKAEFTIFKNDYEETAESVERRLTAIDSDEDGSFATRLNETESTAEGNTNTISDIKTTPEKHITGYQTIKERSDLYERVIGKDEAGIKSNMARMVMTDSLFKTEVIKNVPSAIGGRNYVLKSNDYYYTSDYKVSEYDLSTIPKGTKIKISLWGGLGSTVRTFGVYVNNSSSTQSGNSQFVELKKLDGVFGQGASVPLAKWTGEATLNVDAKKILIFGLDNNNSSPKRVEYVQIETGDYYTDWTAAPEDKASMSAITQLSDNINLKVSKEDLLSQINVQANGVLITSGTNKLNVTPTTTYIENGTIKSAMIESLEADKIKTGTLDGKEVNVINIDAENITSNKTSFIQSNWNDIESSIRIDGRGLLSTASDNSQVYLQNGIVGMRNPGGATVGQIGYRYASGSPQMGLYTSEGSHFSLVQRMSGNDIQTIYITNGGKEYHNSAVNTWIKSTTTNIEGELRVNNANDIRMGGGKIINPYGIHFQSGGELYSLSDGQATRLNGVRTLQIEVNGTRKMEIDGTRNYMYQPLNMKGNGILEQSDERIKTNIRDISQDSLSIVKNTRFADYEMVKDGRSTFGFIAQQLQTVAPHLIFEEDGRLTYDTIEWTQTIAHGLQQLDNKVDDEVAQLKAQVASLQEELAQLKGA